MVFKYHPACLYYFSSHYFSFHDDVYHVNQIFKKFDHHPKLQIFCHHQPFIPLPHQDIAMFLYLHKNHSTYHSMNIASLLGLDFQQRQTLKKAPDQFCEYILNLEKQMNEDHLIEINGKFLSIYTYSLEHEFLGIIIDRTQDMIKKHV